MLFGSLATGTATAGSDVDVLAVRPIGIEESDEQWLESLGAWGDRATRTAGNPVNFVVVGEAEVPGLLRRRQKLWREIAGTGVVLVGSDLGALGTRMLREIPARGDSVIQSIVDV